MGGQLFQPDLVVVVQPGLIVIDEDAGGDVHGVDQDQAFGDAAVSEALLHLGGDIDEGPAAGDLKPEFLAVAFHGFGGGSRFLLKGATGP